jgi:hypothetical protein
MKRVWQSSPKYIYLKSVASSFDPITHVADAKRAAKVGNKIGRRQKK